MYEDLVKRLNAYSAEHQKHGGITAEAADVIEELIKDNAVLRGEQVMIEKYRKKPVIIEAVEYTGYNYPQVQDWIDGTRSIWPQWVHNYGEFKIPTLEGDMTVSLGDYVIKGVNGEFYPCKPDIFEKTYERVEEE